MSWLDAFLISYSLVQANGAVLPQRSTLDFDTTFTVTDDATNKRTIVRVAGSSSTSVTGTGLWYSTTGTLNTAAITLGGDVTQAGSLVSNVLQLTVTGLSGKSLPALTAGVLTYTGSALMWDASGGAAPPGPDVQGTASNWYVQSISGTSGGGGAVPLSDGAFITAASGSNSYINLSAAGSGYGFGYFTFVETGGNPSHAGAVRLSSGTTITSRNAGDTQDISLVIANGSDDIIFGDLTYATGTYLFGSSFTLMSTASYSLAVFNSSGEVQADALAVLFHTAIVNPVFGQEDQSSSVTGSNLILKPQTSSHATDFASGNLVLQLQIPGGTGVESAFEIVRGTTTSFAMGPDPAAGSTDFQMWAYPYADVGTRNSQNAIILTDSTSNLYLAGIGGFIFFCIDASTNAVLALDSASLYAGADIGLTLGYNTQRYTSIWSQTGILAGTSTTGNGHVFSMIAEAGMDGSGATNGFGGANMTIQGGPGGAPGDATHNGGTGGQLVFEGADGHAGGATSGSGGNAGQGSLFGGTGGQGFGTGSGGTGGDANVVAGDGGAGGASGANGTAGNVLISSGNAGSGGVGGVNGGDINLTLGAGNSGGAFGNWNYNAAGSLIMQFQVFIDAPSAGYDEFWLQASADVSIYIAAGDTVASSGRNGSGVLILSGRGDAATTNGGDITLSLGDNGGAGSGLKGLIAISGSTTSTSAMAGSASALPSLPVGYLEFRLEGTKRVIPYYNPPS